MSSNKSYKIADPEHWDSRWHSVFQLLSLDCIVPFWSEMGLAVKAEHQEQVLSAARAAYLTYQGGEAVFYDAHYDQASAEAAIDRFDEDIRHVSQSLAEHVMHWGANEFLDSSSYGALISTWWSAVVGLKNEYPDLRHPLNLPQERIARLVELVERRLVEPYRAEKRRLQLIDELALSEWDKRVFKGSRINAESEEAAAPSVILDAVMNQIANRQFLDFWSVVTSQYVSPEIAEIFAWYQNQMGHVVKRRPHLQKMPS
jgi:hypothetical protein